MMPPRRYRRRHWHCGTCAAELGRIRTTTTGATVLEATGLTALRKTCDRGWLLVCEDGHETAWTGDEVIWRAVPLAA